MYTRKVRFAYLLLTIIFLVLAMIAADATFYEDGSFTVWGIVGCIPAQLCDDFSVSFYPGNGSALITVRVELERIANHTQCHHLLLVDVCIANWVADL